MRCKFTISIFVIIILNVTIFLILFINILIIPPLILAAATDALLINPHSYRSISVYMNACFVWMWYLDSMLPFICISLGQRIAERIRGDNPPNTREA